IADEIVLALLECAHRAPSGFNLQPWEFLVVRDAETRAQLQRVCMDQRQVAEAPVTIVVLSDPLAWKRSYPEVVRESVRTGIWNAARAKRYQKLIALHFRTGPFGLFGFLKRVALPMMRLRRSFPDVVTSRHEAEEYVMRHTMLAVENLMIAAAGAGLDTCPMEGFDEWRLKRLLGIPAHLRVCLLVVLGKRAPGVNPVETYRAPLESRVSWDRYGARISSDVSI
ncbi:MAG: nitroreductase family protein, partial [Deltaproteobacteria bacterium]|nr:nitroreductase family protein [Deltaproteobacteria bacterium]